MSSLSHVVIPARLLPATAGELYRLLGALPKDGRWEVVDVRDGRVWYRPL